MFSSFFGGGNRGGGYQDGHDGRGNNNVGSNVGRGVANPNNVFLRSYRVYSPAFIGKPEINRGNKIILPTSALHELAKLRISYPMTFMISNPQMNVKSYCGVLEFSAEEGMCHIPVWMMENLCVEEGSEIILRNMNLKKGTFIKIRPHETKFIDLANPKAILEQELTHYSVLHKGDTINIQYAGRDYLIDIIDAKPDDQICCVEADIEVEFSAPKDYVEPKAPELNKQSSSMVRAEERKKDEEKLQAIEEKYKRVDGKKLTDKQKQELLQKSKDEEKKRENPDFDPRQHRLTHGIRNYREPGEAARSQGTFTGGGVKIG